MGEGQQSSTGLGRERGGHSRTEIWFWSGFSSQITFGRGVRQVPEIQDNRLISFPDSSKFSTLFAQT